MNRGGSEAGTSLDQELRVSEVVLKGTWNGSRGIEGTEETLVRVRNIAE